MALELENVAQNPNKLKAHESHQSSTVPNKSLRCSSKSCQLLEVSRIFYNSQRALRIVVHKTDALRWSYQTSPVLIHVCFRQSHNVVHLNPTQVRLLQIQVYVAVANHVSYLRFPGIFITLKRLGEQWCTKRTPRGGHIQTTCSPIL